MIEEQVLNATKTLMTEEIIPNVTLQLNEAIQTAVGMAEERYAQKITVLEDSIASKDTEIGLLKQRLNVTLESFTRCSNNFSLIISLLLSGFGDQSHFQCSERT